MIWLRALLFLFAAPGTVCVLIPWLLSRWAPFEQMELGAWRYAGLGPIVIGVAGLLWCFFDFVTKGRGTPNPLDPPRKLVVNALYRYSRNPMYAAGVMVLCGEALWFERPILFGWAAIIFVVFTLFVALYEEPKLRELFGDEYKQYRRSVRRWL